MTISKTRAAAKAFAAQMLIIEDLTADRLAEQFITWVERTVDKLVERFPVGKWGMKIAYNDPWYPNYRIAVQFMRVEDGKVILQREWLEKRAKQIGREQAESMSAKLARKLDGVTDLEVKHINGGDLTLAGKRKGASVVIQQSTVTKVSSKGTWYNQWPALIYVDGKRVTEKNFLAGK